MQTDSEISFLLIKKLCRAHKHHSCVTVFKRKFCDLGTKMSFSNEFPVLLHTQTQTGYCCIAVKNKGLSLRSPRISSQSGSATCGPSLGEYWFCRGSNLEQYCLQMQKNCCLSDEEDKNYSNFIPTELIRNLII